MNSADNEIIFCKLKYLIQHRKISFLLFGDHHSLSKRCICDRLGDEVEEFALAIELTLVIVEQMCHVSISPVHAIHDLALYELCGEEAMLGEEDIMAVHEIVEVVGDD